MSCNKPYDVVAYLKGELDPSEQAPAREHVDACDSCRKDVAKLDRVLHALGKMETVEATPDFRWRVRQAFVTAHPEFIERPIPAERPTLWAAFKAQFSFVPAWSVSLAAHAVLLAIAVAMFASPENPEDKFNDQSLRVQPKGKMVPPYPNAHATTPDQTNRERDYRPPEKVDPRPKPLIDEAIDWKRAKVNSPFATFVAGRTLDKEERRRAYGGDGTAEAVTRGLAWLASQQEPDGRWSAQKFGGLREYEVGITSLALLSFLADGHTPQTGKHADTVKRGIAWLLSQQRVTGLVGAEHGNYMYNHGVAALALIECWMMTGEESLKLPADSAVSFTMAAQNKFDGWDYQRSGFDTDTSVGGWQIHVLRLARESGSDIVVPNLIRAGGRLVDLTASDGMVGYRTRAPGPNGPYALTALGTFAYLMSKSVPETSLVEKYKIQLQRGLPVHNLTGDRKSSDLYFLYWGSLAAHQMGDPLWSEWNAAVKPAVLKAQQADGSWAANADRWSQHGGQIYTTAMGTLVLETYYRYPRLAR
jgi:hypothetical protein